jgi:hypothetical protein
MCPLRRVEADAAGPNALGVLVPPGRRTFLILRPRALAWDLVLLSPGEPAFLDLSPDEARPLVGRLVQALLEWNAGGQGAVETPGRRVQACVGPFRLLACPRRPGEPYRPLTLPDAAAAEAAARAVAAVLRPPPGVEQEYYLNTRHFGP